ncbi:MAG: hypothetical protein SGILL_007160, partial [Bacillariaceae sp.]
SAGFGGNFGGSGNVASSEMERIEANLQTVEQSMGEHQQRPSSQQQPAQQQPQQVSQAQQNEVIELLDSDDDEDNNGKAPAAAAASSVQTNGVSNKRSYSQTYPPSSTLSAPARRNPFPIQVGSTIPGYNGTLAQYQPHQYQQHQQFPQQMMRMHQMQQPQPHQQYNMQHPQGMYHHQAPPRGQAAAMAQMHHQQQQQKRPRPRVVGEPKYVSFPDGHTPTWKKPLPSLDVPRHDPNEPRNYEMSLLNVSEFTITGMTRGMYDTRRTSVLGYRKAIRDISKPHGKAVFERDKENENTESGADGGKWRIPLGAYRALVTFFRNLPNCYIQEIPEDQLKIASLGKARLEKGYPSVEKIVSLGVPRGLASALAPFQRGGVEFVNEKAGRSLIADDMGLGKTIQAIASMSIYHDEWPLLVLTPSSARYHWENEFQQWLGPDSSVKSSKKKGGGDKTNVLDTGDEDNNDDEVIRKEDYRKPMDLLYPYETHVLTTSKEEVFPHGDVKVVICSYGLAPALVESGKIRPGTFKCAIVDESHMLKNMKTKRTSALVPVLHATSRCVLLSGTPALSRPSELWPQLKILSTERDRIWENEAEFVSKYVQRTSAVRRAELHTMLTGTLMIRRLKHDILKSLPNKQREKAIVDVTTGSMRREFHSCMKLLREGKGVMAKLAQKRGALPAPPPPQDPVDQEAVASLKQQQEAMFQHQMNQVHMQVQQSNLDDVGKENYIQQMTASTRQQCDQWLRQRVQHLRNGLNDIQDEEVDRKTVLNRMYSLTAKAKVPLIAENIKKWLDDPTKGKLCVFAHHIFVLDELEKAAGLSNAKGSDSKFIRIDGSTNPKIRQAQIKAFQTDPSIRIAVLGITAAGVAVTLTASSTVWFAELFWTPALMIQAEDRCHRIGQNAVVNCLYFVAEGTLDILLWDLLEKKFRDLGEFVEGKEKMKIVVHKTYDSVKDLQSIFSNSADYDFDNDADLKADQETDEDGDVLIKLEDDLAEDITQLAQEEMVMISQAEGDDEDGDSPKGSSGVSTSENPKAVQGSSADDAICLDDDDDEVVEVEKRSSPPETSQKQAPAAIAPSVEPRKDFQDARLYKQMFDGDTFGFQLIPFKGKLVVGKDHAVSSKPSRGDILAAVNGIPIAHGTLMNHATDTLRTALFRGAVELTFVEDKTTADLFGQYLAEHRARQEQQRNPAPVAKPVVENEDGVIELLDDD